MEYELINSDELPENSEEKAIREFNERRERENRGVLGMQKITIRRLVRIFYTLFIFCSLILIPFIYSTLAFGKRSKHVDSTNQLNLDIRDCKIYLKEDNKLDVGELLTQMETYEQNLDIEELFNQTVHIKAKN